ncbi:MAG: peptide chain release factor 2 [bacterium]|nr:peptide chain release factor 2 [bacterium]
MILMRLHGVFKSVGGYFDIEVRKKRIATIEQEMTKENFWNDSHHARTLGQELAYDKEVVTLWDRMEDDCQALLEMARTYGQENSDQIQQQFETLRTEFEEHEFQALFSGEYDHNNAMIAIHAGTGGVDAMDWADMLLRMYLRFCEQQKWTVRILDKQQGGEAGIKSATLEVVGPYAYGYLQAEAGVHRLVRISPFDGEKLRQTSFALVEVIPDVGTQHEIHIATDDMRIDTYRAGGKGGQGVNTTDSAVRITHIPTGIVVTCQNERSQLQNKETAMRYLKAKLHQLSLTQKEEERQQLRGEYHEAAWGNQIRSYVLNPYKMVKDHRTNYETDQIQDVLDGSLLPFIEEYIKWRRKQ